MRDNHKAPDPLLVIENLSVDITKTCFANYIVPNVDVAGILLRYKWNS